MAGLIVLMRRHLSAIEAAAAGEDASAPLEVVRDALEELEGIAGA